MEHQDQHNISAEKLPGIQDKLAESAHTPAEKEI